MLKRIIILLISSIAIMSSCYDDVDKIDKTPIDREKLRGGWEFVKVEAVVNSPMKKTATTTCKNFMERISKARTFYFTQDTAYVIIDIEDSTEMRINRSYYYTEDYILRFEEERGFYGSWYIPFWYVKNQTDSTVIFYLQKKEIVELMKEDGSVPRSIIDEIESGECCVYMRKTDKYDIFREIEEHEKGH